MPVSTQTIPAASKYFGATAHKYDELRQSKEAFHKDQFVIWHFLNAVVRPGSKLLDVACGTNRISSLVAELGGAYHGIDASSDMVMLAKQKEPHADIRVADACAIPHPSEHFDVVVTVKFLKWIPDDTTLAGAIKEIARVLRPEGVALLHQKIAIDYTQRLDFRAVMKRMLRRRSVKQSETQEPKTRGADETAFLQICDAAGLELRYVVCTDSMLRGLRKKRQNAFYVVSKRSS